jgi:hypothetical protein
MLLCSINNSYNSKAIQLGPSYELPDLFYTGLSDSFQFPILRSFFQVEHDDPIQSSDPLKTNNNLIIKAVEYHSGETNYKMLFSHS